MKPSVYGLLALLYLLHTDVWYWDDPTPLLGAPIGFTYHVLWSLALTVAFALLVRFAWPEQLEAAGAGAERPTGADAETDEAGS